MNSHLLRHFWVCFPFLLWQLHRSNQRCECFLLCLSQVRKILEVVRDLMIVNRSFSMEDLYRYLGLIERIVLILVLMSQFHLKGNYQAECYPQSSIWVNLPQVLPHSFSKRLLKHLVTQLQPAETWTRRATILMTFKVWHISTRPRGSCVRKKYESKFVCKLARIKEQTTSHGFISICECRRNRRRT